MFPSRKVRQEPGEDQSDQTLRPDDWPEILTIAAEMKGLTEEAVREAQENIARSPFFVKMTLKDAQEQLLNSLFTRKELEDAAMELQKQRNSLVQGRNQLLAIIEFVTKTENPDEKKAVAAIKDDWIRELNSQHIEDPHFKTSLEDILKLRLDQKFFPDLDSVFLWLFIEHLLGPSDFPYLKEFELKQKELNVYLADAKRQGGDAAVKQMSKATKEYRTLGPILPMMRGIGAKLESKA